MPLKFVVLLALPIALMAQSRAPVIVELFTSEGCSSCPSADKLLADLERTQPVPNAQILVLSEHVDYWNRLGWRDPFSSAQFSRRQNDYSEAFRKDGVYTPQMVVDGRAEFIGSSGRDAKRAIQDSANRLKASVTLTRDAGGLIVNIEQVPSKTDADVYLAITQNGLHSNITAGENSGRVLDHTGVVRTLTVIGKTRNGSFSKQTAISAGGEHMQAIVFLQDRRTREILGSASLAL